MKKNLQISIVILICALPVSVYTCRVFAAESTKAQENLEKLVKTKSCKGCDLSGLTLNRLDLADADLQGADLSSAKLSLTNLTRANLRNTNLRGAIFGGTDLSDADLRGADLRGTSLDSSYHQGAQFDGEFIAAKPYADVGDAEVEKEVFVADSVKPKPRPETKEVRVVEPAPAPAPVVAESGAPPEGVSKKALQVGNERQASAPASLSPAPVAKKITPLQQAIVDVPGQDQKTSAIPALSPVPIKEEAKKPTAVEAVTANPPKQHTASVPEQKPKEIASVVIAPQTIIQPEAKQATADEPAKKTSKGIGAATMVASPPSGSQVEVAQEKRSTPQTTPVKALKTTKVTEEKSVVETRVGTLSQNPVAGKTKEDNLKTLLDKKKCFACDLSGLDLAGKNLDSADLEKANLTGSNLEKTDLEKANLKGALLVKASLRKASLKNADFYKADLTGADLTGAKVEGAMFDSAQTASAVGLKEAIGAAAK